jgi:hypothetical protein
MAANEVAPWRPQATTLSLEQKVSSAKMILSVQASPSQAARLAKQLVGSYAHLRPDNPETFIASIAAVLAQYPLGVSEEVADPRKGIARKAEFLSIKALVDWCDTRLAFYQGLASYAGGPITPRPTVEELTREQMERGGAAMRGLFRALKDKRDVSAISFEEAIEIGRDKPAEAAE